jgi:hypothetical protein
VSRGTSISSGPISVSTVLAIVRSCELPLPRPDDTLSPSRQARLRCVRPGSDPAFSRTVPGRLSLGSPHANGGRCRTDGSNLSLGPLFVGLLNRVLPFLTVLDLGAMPPSLCSQFGFRVFDSPPDSAVVGAQRC